MNADELKQLIEVEAFKRNISEATLCKYSVGSNRLHKTLSSGGSCTLKVMNRLLEWVSDNPPSVKNKNAA